MLHWLNSLNPDDFPDTSQALTDPNGLLAVGGDLSPERLLIAYRHGIFPWYSEGQPILWWSPDPRAVLRPEHLKISRSLAKTLRRGQFTVTFDQEFDEVMRQCSLPRRTQSGTWISDEMRYAYHRLHRSGYAHSVEVWRGAQLVGGLYGIGIGKMFFGESMFSVETDASKVGFIHLVAQLQDWSYQLIDCQVESAHLRSLGATLISREEFVSQIKQASEKDSTIGTWTLSHQISNLLRTTGRLNIPNAVV